MIIRKFLLFTAVLLITLLGCTEVLVLPDSSEGDPAPGVKQPDSSEDGKEDEEGEQEQKAPGVNQPDSSEGGKEDEEGEQEQKAPGVNQPPILKIESVDPLIQGAWAVLDASNSSDPDNDSLSFSWSFDGEESILSTEAVFRHQFTEPNIYKIQVTLSDGEAEVSDSIQIICVEDDLSSYYTAYELLTSKHIDTFEDEFLLKSSISKMIEALDDQYAHHYTLAELEKFHYDKYGKLIGIGVYLARKDGFPMITGTIPGSPAEAGGLTVGDLIIEVDGKDLTDKDLQYSVDLLKGSTGTSVTLKIRKKEDGSETEVTLTRAPFQTPSVSAYGIVKDTIGYVKLDSFSQTNMIDELVKKLTYLQSEGAKRFILDLRNNGGGLLDNAVKMVDLFLGKRKIIATSQYRGYNLIYETGKDPQFTEDLVILQNGYSASATEMFSGAMQDHDRAHIIGETSFGKASIQGIYELPNGGVIKFTIGKYLSPKGSIVDGVGISPDDTVTPRESYKVRSQEDDIYQKAIEYFLDGG